MWERYANGMEPATRHLCFSVSKSVVATVAGILVGRGQLDPDALVTEVIDELGGTSWEAATVQHVLDMRTGTRFNEIYDEVGGDADIFGQVIGWFPRTDGSVPHDTYTYLAALSADRDHGGPFDYRTPLTSMLGWLCERASGERLAPLIGRELWSPMGAEFEASLAVDAIGNGFVGGGFNATLRDMARFGELWRRGGTLPDGSQLVPADVGAGHARRRPRQRAGAARRAGCWRQTPDTRMPSTATSGGSMTRRDPLYSRDRHPRSVRHDRRGGRAGRRAVLEPAGRRR